MVPLGCAVKWSRRPERVNMALISIGSSGPQRALHLNNNLINNSFYANKPNMYTIIVALWSGLGPGAGGLKTRITIVAAR